MAATYRPRTQPFGSGPSPVTGVRLSPETREGFQEIRRLFQRRFPMSECPTLSACLEVALKKYLETNGNDPRALQAELAEFRERYGAAR